MTNFDRKLFEKLARALDKTAFVPPPPPLPEMPPGQPMMYGQGGDPSQMMPPSPMYGQGGDPSQMMPPSPMYGQGGDPSQMMAMQQEPEQSTGPAKTKKNNRSAVHDRLAGDLLNRITENAARLDELEQKIELLSSPPAEKIGSSSNVTLLSAMRNLLVDQR